MGLLLTACPPPDDEEENDVEADGTLTLARTGDVENLDPHLATAFQDYQTLELVYDTLTEFDADLNVVPGLAESFDFADDGMTLTLELRQGVTFHEGEEFTSGDVRASLERVLDEETGAVGRTNIITIEAIETPDDHTVVLELSEPDAALPAALADINIAMISAAAIDEGGIGSEPNGTGPFLFGEWVQGESLELPANEDYWGDGPHLEEIVQRTVPDESSVLAGLRAGQYDMGILSDPAVATQAEDDALHVESTPGLAYHTLMLNTNVEPLDDENVRQAMACALDRQDVLDAAMFGQGEVTGPFTIPEFFFDPHEGLPCDGRDVELAEELLAEAGHEDGFSIETIVITGEYVGSESIAESIQSQLADIGVDLELEILDSTVYVERWLEPDFEAAVALNGGRPDPHHMYTRYFTSDGGLNHVATYSSETLDQLFADGRTETDEQQRQAIYQEISEELLEASPWLWLFTSVEFQVMQDNVEGFTPRATGSLISLRDVRIEE